MFSASQRQQLAEAAQAWGIALDDATLARFARFADLLEDANRQFNLTRVPPEDIVTRHFLDSLALTQAVTLEPGMRLLDVGTGAGFPGLPLALVFPQLQVTLMDATRKRLRFLDAVLTELGIANALTLHGRAEEIARLPQHRAQYDLVTARAVAKLDTLAGWLIPFVRPGGCAIAYKSRDIDAELQDAAPLLKDATLHEVIIPHTDILRKLVIFNKFEPPASLETQRHRGKANARKNEQAERKNRQERHF